MLLEGVVIERYGQVVKVRTNKGEALLRFRKKAPVEGEHVRLVDKPSNSNFFVAEMLVDSKGPLPSLKKLDPFLQTIGKFRDAFEAHFCVAIADSICERLQKGELSKNFYLTFAEYYKTGEVNTRMIDFGLWLFTVGYPYEFKSLPDENNEPLHIMIDRKYKKFEINFFKNGVYYTFNGAISTQGLTLKVKPVTNLDFDLLERLRQNLLRRFSAVFVKVGEIDELFA